MKSNNMETTVKNGELNLALQVALQTMKERCVTLQKRLANVEEENLELKECIENKKVNVTPTTGSNGGAAELFQLRLQVSEMQRQKTQMTDHINMVSEENRKLWARLSQVAKEHDNFLGSIKNNNDDGFCIGPQNSTVDLIKERGAAVRAALTQQNLIRSKTFTQHSPNPNLRHKVLHENSNTGIIDFEELEESFKRVVNMTSTTAAGDDDDDDDNESGIDIDVKKCYDDMQELHQEAKQQQFQLSSALNALERKLVSLPCPDCVKRSKKPEMADKSLETDDSLNELQQITNNKMQMDLVQQIAKNNNNSQSGINIIQDKIQADSMDKTCPMCGRVFNNFVSFDAFRQHVEEHFIDDSSNSSSNGNDLETSIDRNFEFVSHAVGDF